MELAVSRIKKPLNSKKNKCDFFSIRRKYNIINNDNCFKNIYILTQDVVDGYLTSSVWKDLFKNELSTFYILNQCFPAFFGSRHPYIVLKIFGDTPSWFDRYKDQGILTFGGTPGTISRNPCVPRHPGWESLS